MAITRIQLERFTAFEKLDFKPSPGMNLLIGANGTGKTHLMKVAYAACDITKSGQRFPEKLTTAFLPRDGALGRLVKRQGKSATAAVKVSRSGGATLELRFSNHAKDWRDKKVKRIGGDQWVATPLESVYIPVKEMLASAPGFRSLYAHRQIHFESIYADIIDRAFLPILRGPTDEVRRRLLLSLQKAMDGKVTVKREVFFLKNRQGELEFTLLAEGLRKLGLLWLIIQNGTLTRGSVLFWDEPETNLNPRLFSVVVEILLALQRMGVQVFVSTHDYAILKECELAAKPTDEITYTVMYRPTPDADVLVETASEPFRLEHSPIAEAMTSLYNREIQKSLGAQE
ncbi:MAG: AAA family ATPase [Candidatus Eisenbacteria bacterium]|nr:AAA family ATPase [Candidatus Eisenbacteria bacterium]